MVAAAAWTTIRFLRDQATHEDVVELDGNRDTGPAPGLHAGRQNGHQMEVLGLAEDHFQVALAEAVEVTRHYRGQRVLGGYWELQAGQRLAQLRVPEILTRSFPEILATPA